MVDQRGEPSLEEALSLTESDAEAALGAATALAAQLRKVKAGAAVGNLRDLVKALDVLEQRVGEVRQRAEQLVAGWRFDEREYLQSGAFTAELRAVGETRGLAMVEQDGRLLAYPSVIRLLPAEAAVEVDRKRERRIRPSVLVERLRAAQERAPRLKAEPFLEALLTVYDLLLKRDGKESGGTVRLVDVYELLTPLPGQGKDYSLQEFTRDVYALDRGGVRETRDGRKVRFPAATGTKTSKTLSIATPNDDMKVYYGIAFDR